MSETVTLTSGADDTRRVLLVVLDEKVTEHPLPDEGVLFIGRDSSADIVIDHPTLSRKHAKFTLSTHVTVEDCGSHNGTIVGGRKLAHGEVVLVAPGRSIEVGDALVVVRVGSGGAGAAVTTAEGQRRGQGSFEQRVIRVAAVDAPVLIAGERGSGKTFVAERIHALSARKTGPFVVLDGHGALAKDAIAAAIARAHHGVLFVRRPGELSADNQALLVEAIATAGDAIRTIAATTVDLVRLVERGAFAPRLLDRLSTLTLLVPPLRARLRELPTIIEEIVASIAAEHGRTAPLVDVDALGQLERHTWPGNVRELKSALTQALLVGKGRVLTASHFEFVAAPEAGATPGTLSSAVSDAEYRRILEVLRECDGNQTRAAKMLGISRGTLISRLQRYAIPRPRK